MTTVRYDVLSGVFCVIAQERSKRPVDFPRSQKRHELSKARVDDCPFCPGNESMTPPEVAAFREGRPDEPGWSVRVVPNKFPAFVPPEKASEEEQDAFQHGLGETDEVLATPERAMYWELPAIGTHEVVIDSPVHNATIGTYSQETVTGIVRMLRNRHRDLSCRPEIAYVHIFRNWGPEGGASLSHPHFQIIGLPFLPQALVEEGLRLHGYMRRTGRCLVCDLAEREMEKDERVVMTTEAFRVFAPFASRFSYETLIIPKTHRADFGEISEEECKALGTTLTGLFARYEALFPSFSYNVVWHSIGRDGETRPGFHWHIHVFPRLTSMAGLELGTGVFINPTSPELAAEILRSGAEPGESALSGRKRRSREC